MNALMFCNADAFSLPPSRFKDGLPRPPPSSKMLTVKGGRRVEIKGRHVEVKDASSLKRGRCMGGGLLRNLFHREKQRAGRQRMKDEEDRQRKK